MLIYANEVPRGLQNLVKRFHGVKTLSIDTKNTSVGYLIEKLEHFIVFWLQNLVKRLPWDDKP